MIYFIWIKQAANSKCLQHVAIDGIKRRFLLRKYQAPAWIQVEQTGGDWLTISEWHAVQHLWLAPYIHPTPSHRPLTDTAGGIVLERRSVQAIVKTTHKKPRLFRKHDGLGARIKMKNSEQSLAIKIYIEKYQICCNAGINIEVSQIKTDLWPQIAVCVCVLLAHMQMFSTTQH